MTQMDKSKYYRKLHNKIARDVGTELKVVAFIRAHAGMGYNIIAISNRAKEKAQRSPNILYQKIVAFMKFAPMKTLRQIIYDYPSYEDYLEKTKGVR